MQVRTDRDTGIRYVSSDYLTYGDYVGAGTIGMSNIECIQEDFDDEFLDLERLNYGYHKLWIAEYAMSHDGTAITDIIAKLEDSYPIIDDEKLSELEMRLTMEQFPYDVLDQFFRCAAHRRLDIGRELGKGIGEYENASNIFPESIFPEYAICMLKRYGIYSIVSECNYDPWHPEGTGDNVYFDTNAIVTLVIGTFARSYLKSRYLADRKPKEYSIRINEIACLIDNENHYSPSCIGRRTAFDLILRSAGLDKFARERKEFNDDYTYYSCLQDLAEENEVHWLKDLMVRLIQIQENDHAELGSENSNA